MATAKLTPKLAPVSDYATWLSAVESALLAKNMKLDAWQQNWTYDFKKDFELGLSARDAALHACHFWWGNLLAESWT